MAPDLMAGTGGDLSLVALAVAGGGNVDGTYMANPALYKSPTVPEPLEVEHGTGAEREWKLLDFVDAPSIIVNEEPVSRREVIKYAAIYAGGVHLAPDIKKADEEMVERIHKIRGTLNRASKAGLIQVDFAFELLSIGQLVSGADDIDRLATAIEERRRAM